MELFVCCFNHYFICSEKEESFDINEYLFVHNEPISMEEFRKFSEKEINVLIFML